MVYMFAFIFSTVPLSLFFGSRALFPAFSPSASPYHSTLLNKQNVVCSPNDKDDRKKKRE